MSAVLLKFERAASKPAPKAEPAAEPASVDLAISKEAILQASLYMRQVLAIAARLAEMSKQPDMLVARDGGRVRSSAVAALLVDSLTEINPLLAVLEEDLRALATEPRS